MKWIIGATGLMCVFTLQAVMAQSPVTMSDPSPAIGQWHAIEPTQPAVFTYTVTNNVPGHAFPLTLTGATPPIYRVQASSHDCGNILAAGPSTCYIAIDINPVLEDLGESIHKSLQLTYGGRDTVTKNIDFSVLPTFIAAGSTSSSNPAFYTNTGGGSAGGEVWVTPASVSSRLPVYGILNDSSCTGVGVGAMCVAAGQDNTGENPPLALYSFDGGIDWTRSALPRTGMTGFFYGTSCTGDGVDARCIAVGQDQTVQPPPFSGNQPPLILVLGRSDGGRAMKSTITDLPTNGVLWGVGCTGSGSSAVCTAVGEDYAGNMPPLLITTRNGGFSWTTPVITDMPRSGYFNSASCTGSGSTAICIAAGQDYDLAGPPLLYVSRDGAQTWTKLTSSDLPADGVFWNSSCTGSGDKAVCTAVGEDDTGSNPPLIFSSRDGGQTWVRQRPSTMTVNGALWSVSCAGNGSDAVCAAGGQDQTGNQPPLLLVTKNGARSWLNVAPTGVTTYGYFDATSCTGAESTAICTATGQDYFGYQPAIIYENRAGADNMDQASSWVGQTLPDTKNGVILTASGASGVGGH